MTRGGKVGYSSRIIYTPLLQKGPVGVHRFSSKAPWSEVVAAAAAAAVTGGNDRKLQFSRQVAGAANYAIDQRYQTALAGRPRNPQL